MPTYHLTEYPVWDNVAEGYEKTPMKHLGLYGKEAIDSLSLTGNERVLDIGAGPGMISRQICNKVNHVTATDFSKEMLKLLEGYCAEQHIQNIQTVLADSSSLPFESQSFDIVFSTFAMVFVADRSKGFSEFHRVIKQSGMGVFMTWAPFEMSPATELIVEALMYGKPELRQAFPQGVINSLDNPKVLEEELHRVGFKDISISLVKKPIILECAEEFWLEMTEGSALVWKCISEMTTEEATVFREKAMTYLSDKISSGFSTYTTAWIAKAYA